MHRLDEQVTDFFSFIHFTVAVRLYFFLLCRWGPQLEQATYKNRQRLYLSEQASESRSLAFTIILAGNAIHPCFGGATNIACGQSLLLIHLPARWQVFPTTCGLEPYFLLCKSVQFWLRFLSFWVSLTCVMLGRVNFIFQTCKTFHQNLFPVALLAVILYDAIATH